MNQVARLAFAVGENVFLPVGSYSIAIWLGVTPVWALVTAAGVSLTVNAARWVITHEVTTLGLIVLGRFSAAVAVGLITGDARLELVKDLVITGLIGIVAVGSLRTQRPLIARIRRDFSADPDGFDRIWAEEPSFRQLHRKVTFGWAAALVGEMVLGTVLVYAVPLTAAVIVTTVASPVVIIALISWTELSARRWYAADDDPARTGCSPVP